MPYTSSTPSSPAYSIGGASATFESAFSDDSDDQTPYLWPIEVYMIVPAGGGASGPGETAAAGAAAAAAAARTAAANTEAEVNAPPNRGEQPNYPYVVTLQNGRTQLHISQAMGKKAIKAVADGQPASDATPEDLVCYQYLLW